MTEPDIDLSMPFVAEALPVVAAMPANVNSSVVKGNFSLTKDLSPEQISVLHNQGYPLGLAEELGSSRIAYPLRFWIVDNSGSMRNSDGHRIVGSQKSIKVVPCTRWSELQGAVEYHAELAGLLQVTTVFRMLNDPGVTAGPQEFSVAEDIGESTKNIEQDVERAKSVVRQSEPRGVTPLTEHLLEIRSRIQSVEHALKSQGQQAVIVIATDGLPSDHRGVSTTAVKEQFIDMLQSLQSLPLWIVVRLCTDDDEVVQYYNNLDQSLELPLEVIDDFFGEGWEIRERNKWLNYAMPLHRCREMGYHHRIFDLLDERLLTKDELGEYVTLLFGKEALADAPDIHEDWKGFSAALSKVVQNQGKQWNPSTRKMDWWIDMKQLERSYGEGFRLFRRSKR